MFRIKRTRGTIDESKKPWSSWGIKGPNHQLRTQKKKKRKERKAGQAQGDAAFHRVYRSTACE